MVWHVSSLNNIEIIKKDKETIEGIRIYLENKHADKFICGGTGADAIIKITEEKYLVCEIKRPIEKPVSWFNVLKCCKKYFFNKLEIRLKKLNYKEAKIKEIVAAVKSADGDCDSLNKIRKYWKVELEKEVERQLGENRYTAPFELKKKMEEELNKKLKMQYAWPITIGGQLEESFSKNNSCFLETKGGTKTHPLKVENSTRCLIFDKTCEGAVKAGLNLLFKGNIPGLVMYTIADKELENVCIWEFGDPSGKNLLGWYPNPTKPK